MGSLKHGAKKSVSVFVITPHAGGELPIDSDKTHLIIQLAVSGAAGPDRSIRVSLPAIGMASTDLWPKHHMSEFQT